MKSNGWFFRSCYEDKLFSNGAKYIKTEDDYDVINGDENEYSGPNFVKYGKGWLLVPKKSHPDYGEKYYHGGWWNSSQNAWFFRNSVKNSL